MNLRWDHFVNPYDAPRFPTSSDGRDNRHAQFVRDFARVVSVIQDKTNSVIDLYRDILRAVEDLATCSYTSEAFSELLSRIQTAVSVFRFNATACLTFHLPNRSIDLIWKVMQISNTGWLSWTKGLRVSCYSD